MLLSTLFDLLDIGCGYEPKICQLFQLAYSSVFALCFLVFLESPSLWRTTRTSKNGKLFAENGR